MSKVYLVTEITHCYECGGDAVYDHWGVFDTKKKAEEWIDTIVRNSKYAIKEYFPIYELEVH
jgi:hypothetical protein